MDVFTGCLTNEELVNLKKDLLIALAPTVAEHWLKQDPSNINGIDNLINEDLIYQIHKIAEQFNNSL